ncbi:MAG: class B sortase [Oscillospiraceae bacterium]|jgi:sortase B|nr:class B sortase [Oscillospiraceae bacterium]
MKRVSTKKSKYILNIDFFKKNLRWIILGVLGCIFVFSSTMLIITLFGRFQARYEYEDLREIATSGQNVTGDVYISDTEERGQNGNSYTEGQIQTTIAINHEALYELNSDYIGWILIHGTEVNYPIVRCRNNEKYIYTTFLQERNRAGAIFLDYLTRDRFDRFAILYGHNREDGTMFTTLHEYRDDIFREENSFIMIFTPEHGVLNYRVVDVKVTSVTDKIFTLRGGSQADINAYIQRYDVADDTPILVLSTCTDSWDSNERLIVVAARSEGLG